MTLPIVARAAIEAARKTLNGTETIKEAAVVAGVGRTSVYEARILLMYGSPEDIQKVVEGKVQLNRLAASIRSDLTDEQRQAARKNAGAKTAKRRTNSTAAVLDAAQRTISERITVAEVGDETGINRTMLTNARIVLMFGTPEEVSSVRNGDKGLQGVMLGIRARVTPEQRKQLRFMARQNQHKVLQNREIGVIIWSKLQPALANLAQMPSAETVLGLVKSHSIRQNTVNHYLTAAKKWLEEFTHAWEDYQRTKLTNGHTDSGNGAEPSGEQHTEPST